MADVNKGITIGGSANVRAGAMAAGDHARATGSLAETRDVLESKGLDEIVARLDDLVAALDAHAAEIEDVDVARSKAEEVAREAASDRPDKSRIRSLLGELTVSVASVTNAITAVGGLAQAVDKLI